MPLEPFPYHLAIADKLERNAPDLWQWFQSEHISPRYQDLTTADLQRRSSRLPRNGGNEGLYALAETARDRLDLDASVALFQLQDAPAFPHTYLVFVPDEIRIAFAGDILNLLAAESERLAAMGRAIARFGLYHMRDGRIHIAARMLRWLVRQEGCAPEMFETWRRFRLLIEAYCDMGGFVASKDRAAAVRVLFKGRPSAQAGDPEAYLKLADANIGDRNPTPGPSELDVRAVALARSTAAGGDTARISESLFSTPIELGSLDLLDQDTLGKLTREIFDRVLSEPAGGTPAAIAHAREIIPDYKPVSNTGPLKPPPAALGASVTDYLTYLLLDLATVEGTRLRNAIAVAAGAADELGIGTRFREIARRELRGRRGLQAGLAGRAA
ncbi:MAG: hypothetical protein AB7E81_10395 [Hyphomicrobiaceae bacterium]